MKEFFGKQIDHYIVLLNNYLILTMSVMSFIGCESTPKHRIFLPLQLSIRTDLFLGQGTSHFESMGDCTKDNSDGHYCCELPNGNYFNYFCINPGFSDSHWIELIRLQSTIQGEQEEVVIRLETKAKRIISILENSFGSGFVVTDDNSLTNINSLKRPMLYWKTDSCIVMFSYLPKSLFYKRRMAWDNVNASYVLILATPKLEAFSGPFLPSSQYTRESLGLL